MNLPIAAVIVVAIVPLAIVAFRDRRKRLEYEASLSVEEMNEYHQMRQLGVRWRKTKEMMGAPPSWQQRK